MKNNPRYVLLSGATRKRFPDCPEPPADGSVLLWDRQLKQPAATIHPAYAQAICLETTYSGEQAPFTNLEKWFNELSDEAAASEGLTPTAPEYREQPETPISLQVADNLNSQRFECTWEHPGYIEIPCANAQYVWNAGNINPTWSCDLMAKDGGVVVDNVDLGIPNDSKDVQAIAIAIIRAVNDYQFKA